MPIIAIAARAEWALMAVEGGGRGDRPNAIC